MPQQIDQIQRLDIDKSNPITRKEIDDFFAKSKESDIKDLAIQLKSSLEKNQTILDWSVDKAYTDISDKIKNSKELSPNEIKILKLRFVIKEKKSLQNFDATWSSELQVRFPLYKANIQTITENIARLKNKEVSLPDIQFQERSPMSSIHKLSDWAKMNFTTEFEKIRINAEIQYQDKQHAQSYIQYACTKFAFEKYAEIVSKNAWKIKQEAGYTTESECENDSHKINQLQKFMTQELAKEFPTIQKTQENRKIYQGKIQTLARKNGYEKPGVFESQYKIYANYSKKVEEFQTKEIDPQKLKDSLESVKNPDLTNAKQVEVYMDAVNYVKYYSQRSQEIKGNNSSSIEKFEKYNQEIQSIHQKFGPDTLKKWESEISHYGEKIQQITKTYGGEINLQRYQKYMTLLQKNKTDKALATVSGVQSIFANPSGENSPFVGLVLDAQEQKANLAKKDAFYATMKSISPELYTLVNFATGTWNGLVDALVGTGSSLGLMIMSIYKNESELQESMDRKQAFDSFLKIGISTAMQEPPVKDGKRNLGFDNTINQVGSQLANMMVLLTGGATLTKGFAKVGMLQVAPKLGLFSSAMIMQTGRSFEEGLTQGLNKQEAFGYAMLQSIVSSSLELISPNNLIMGERKVSLAQLIGKEGQKKILTQILKHQCKQMGEEILQEETQFLAQKGIDRMLNEAANFKLDASMSWADFTTTAVLTGLTTGIASGGQSYHQAKMDVSNTDARQQRKQVLNHIVADESRYQNYLSKIDGMISKSSGESASQVQTLKAELQIAHAQQSNPEQFKKIVIENAQLSDESRIVKVEELLGIKLSPEQVKIVLQAHKIGQGGVFEYTLTDIRQKSDLLESIGITGNQKRILMEYGFVGQYPENIQVQAEKITNQENTKETKSERTFERNTTRMEIHEIERKSDVIAIGDLEGNLENFKLALNKHNIIDGEGNWIGGDAKIVLHGDILADRTATSFDIFQMIGKLNETARKQGGEIIVIKGNHDKLLTDFLTSPSVDDIFEKRGNKYMIKNSGKNGGLNELAQFLGVDQEKIIGEWTKIRNDPTMPELERMQILKEQKQKILENMKNDVRGKAILEQISNMKIMEQIDDCLYMHVAPHDKLLKFIDDNAKLKPDGSKDIAGMIDEVNSLWRKNIRRNTFGEGSDLTKEEKEKIINIQDIFLSDKDETYEISKKKEYYDRLKNSGINMIQHGHIGKLQTVFEHPVQIKSNDGRKPEEKDNKIDKGIYTGFPSESTIESTSQTSKEIPLTTEDNNE